MQNLDSLPVANELPIVNMLYITHTWTNVCRTKLLLPVAKILPIASIRVRPYKCSDVRIAFVRAVLSELLFRANELKHKSTLLSINEHL